MDSEAENVSSEVSKDLYYNAKKYDLRDSS